MTGLSDRLQALGHDQRQPIELVAAAEVDLPRSGNHLTGVQADPNTNAGVIKGFNASQEIKRCEAGHDAMHIVGNRRTKDGKDAITEFAMNDAAMRVNGDAHGFHRRRDTRDRLLQLKAYDEIRRPMQVCAQKGDVLALDKQTARALAGRLKALSVRPAAAAPPLSRGLPFGSAPVPPQRHSPSLGVLYAASLPSTCSPTAGVEYPCQPAPAETSLS
nr:hypothetical protein [Reyranella sp. CPCC 100927]